MIRRRENLRHTQWRGEGKDVPFMIFDEAALLPGMEACYNAVNPVAGQIIAISSAGPGWFADQCSY